MSGHDAVTFGLIYLAIGSLVWLWLFTSGAVADVADSRKRRGLPSTATGAVIAGAMVIVAWPMIALAFLKGGRAR